MYKLFIKRNNISLAIILFLIIFIVFAYFKPSFLFNRDGSIRNFGISKSKCTIFPIWLLVIFIAILSYLFIQYFIIFK